MAGLDFQALVIISLAVSLGSFVKGFTGFGLPLFSIPIMAGFIGLDHAVAVMIIPSIVSNFLLLWTNRRQKPDLTLFGPLLVTSIFGIFLGAWLLQSIPTSWLMVFLASWIFLYVAMQKSRLRFHLNKSQNRIAGPITGFIAGISQGSSGVTTAIIVSYLHALDLQPRSFVYANALIYQAFWFVTGAALWAFGMFDLGRAGESLYALIFVLVFVPMGSWLTDRVDKARFENLIFLFLLLIAGRLVYLAVV